MELGSIAVTSLISLVDERLPKEVVAPLVGNAGCSVLSDALHEGMDLTVWSSTLQDFMFADGSCNGRTFVLGGGGKGTQWNWGCSSRGRISVTSLEISQCIRNSVLADVLWYILYIMCFCVVETCLLVCTCYSV